MIVTPLMWSSLDWSSKYYAQFWMFPFDWDPSRKKFVVNRKPSKLIYYFINMMALGFAPVACLTILAANYSGMGKFTFFEVLLTVLDLLIVIVTIVTELSFFNYSGPMKLVNNYLIRLDARIQPRKLMSNILSYKGAN